MAYIHAPGGRFGYSRSLGQLSPEPTFRLSPGTLTRPPRPRPSLGPTTALRFPPFETITGFARHSASLGTTQFAAISRVADHIVRAGRTAHPFNTVRCVGYIGSDEWGRDLGVRRAQAVQAALLGAIRPVAPGTAATLRFLVDDCGLSGTGPKVEIYLWIGMAREPPRPCTVRLPSPAEAARMVMPTGPETPEERIRRILRELPPPPPPPPWRSFDEMFGRWVDRNLDSALNRARVPHSLRGPIREDVHAAVRRGAEEILNRVLAASGLGGEAQEAIRAAAQAALRPPVR